MLGLYYTTGLYRKEASMEPRQQQASQSRAEPDWATRTADIDDGANPSKYTPTYYQSTPCGSDAQFFANYPFNREPLSEGEKALQAGIFESAAKTTSESRKALQAGFLKAAASANSGPTEHKEQTPYDHDVWNHSSRSPERGNTLGIRKTVGTLAAATLLITIVGALAATYFLVPGAQTWMNAHAITPLTAQHLTVGQGLCMIGLPIAGAMTGLGLGLYVWQKSKRKAATPELKGIREPRFSEGQKRAAKVAGFVTIAALLIAGACLAYYFCPQVQQGVSQVLNHKLTMGQSLGYIGAPTLALGILANGALALYLRRQKMNATHHALTREVS